MVAPRAGLAKVDWLVDKFDLDMSLLARLGGHSAPRTHRGKEHFPGMTITYALIQMVEKILGLGVFIMFILFIILVKSQLMSLLAYLYISNLFLSL